MLSKEALGFFKALIETPSPSGFEQPAARLFRDYVASSCESVTTDIMGNSIAVLNPDAERKIMLSSHIDQVGMIVKHINDQGYIYFSPIGGFYTINLPGSKVVIHSKKGSILGVIAMKGAHLLEEEEKKQSPKMESLWIDCGFKDKEDALKSVSIGDPITFELQFAPLQNDRLLAPGLDNKTGVIVLAEVLKRLSKEKLKVAVYGVATVQEEMGMRGAKTAAYGINAEVGVALDVTTASDHPGLSKEKWGNIVSGKGPVIEKGPNINSQVFDLLEKAAQENKIPYQIDAEGRSTGTDANLMQVNKEGMATAFIGVPLRYLHSQAEVLSIEDIEKAIELVVEFIKDLEKETSFVPE